MEAEERRRPAPTDELARLAAQEWFTTGEVATICQVAVSNVKRWCDGGSLPSSTVPLSNHRRIRREDLVAFLRTEGLLAAANEIAAPRILHFGGLHPEPPGYAVAGAEIVRPWTGFQAGVEASAGRFEAMVLDFQYASGVVKSVAADLALADWLPATAARVAILGEDQTPEELPLFIVFSRHFKRPFDPAELEAYMAERLGLKGGRA